MEISTLPGIADVLVREIYERYGAGSALREQPPTLVGARGREDAVRVLLPAPTLPSLHALRTATSVQRLLHYPVPRPRALLGDALARSLAEDFRRVVTQLNERFNALRLEAAGKESDVMVRLASHLANAVGLPVDAEAGDLLVRVRPENEGWTLLVRTTPRPLSVRPWRVCDRPGGLNAALAAAMVMLVDPPARVRAVNPFAGSGTLAITLALARPQSQTLAFDQDLDAVACARQNVDAARVAARVDVREGDARNFAMDNSSVDLIVADPPWGDVTGSSRENRELYPLFLREAARVLRAGGRMVWVTHEVKWVRAYLAQVGPWRVLHERQVWHGGHHPLVLVMERRAESAVLR